MLEKRKECTPNRILVLTDMYIGHYKAYNSPEEFFTEERNSLDFPTQVSLGSKNYLLYTTYHADTPSAKRNLLAVAKRHGIKSNVKID